MNTFLRGNKILEVENQLVTNEHGAYWCFCVRYIEGSFVPSAERSGGGKVDYRKVLDEETFQRFSKLREIRKKAAAEEGVSAGRRTGIMATLRGFSCWMAQQEHAKIGTGQNGSALPHAVLTDTRSGIRQLKSQPI
jgi:hypothetical protein